MKKRYVKTAIVQEIHPEGLVRVRQLLGGVNVNVVSDSEQVEYALPKERIEDCEVLFATFAPRNLHEMVNLKWLQLGSAGYEQLVGLGLPEMGVRVTNGGGANDGPIAEWCLAMMLVFERNLLQLLENQRQRIWERSAKFQSELRGKRVGIMGYGSIGRVVSRLVHSLGMEVWAIARSPIGPRPNRYVLPDTGDPEGILPHRTFTLDQMEGFLPHLDYLVLTIPRTASTVGIIGERELRLMKTSAVLLNPSRGPLVDEGSLVRGLREGWIAGAALDAHYEYPLPPEHPLWAMPNVVLSPHISGSNNSRYYLSHLWDLFATNVERYLRGQPLLNELVESDLT